MSQVAELETVNRLEVASLYENLVSQTPASGGPTQHWLQRCRDVSVVGSWRVALIFGRNRQDRQMSDAEHTVGNTPQQ